MATIATTDEEVSVELEPDDLNSSDMDQVWIRQVEQNMSEGPPRKLVLNLLSVPSLPDGARGIRAMQKIEQCITPLLRRGRDVWILVKWEVHAAFTRYSIHRHPKLTIKGSR